jgi:hypothetical protein
MITFFIWWFILSIPIAVFVGNLIRAGSGKNSAPIDKSKDPS